ncbi:efflux RND transporter periplasmic adaptor subunit [Pseudoxanthomonas daejeonensis]|uniref:Efflux transporter periplasmic adaptor subunit n=1 Tax=Pseudoxanthomonas daejeonensis TaxID=266062 RepID=A0ABQ6Z3Z5_9GAMM|nr:efflux transporter periplasmic adaptor subunit [Pseudoxanthomonas daejeonensis]
MIRSLGTAIFLALLLAACGRGAADGEAGHDHADGGHEGERLDEAGREKRGAANSNARNEEDADHAHDADGAEEGEAHADSTVIAADIAQSSGIRVAPAAAGIIADEHEVQGLLTPVEGRAAQVSARYPGPIRSLAVNVGDRVRAGQALAAVESNLSLSTYTVTSPLAGVVLARHASLGSVASEGSALFEVADLSQLWVDLHIFGSDAGHIVPGAPVTVTRLSDGVTAQTTLERVLPGTATASQSTVARAVLENEDGLWRPGSAVRARITVEQQPAALVVPLTALQSLEGRDVVFVREGDRYQAHPVKLGKRDGQRVEVLEGLNAGDEVVVEQSYLVKADIGKAGASHEH